MNVLIERLSSTFEFIYTYHKLPDRYLFCVVEIKIGEGLILYSINYKDINELRIKLSEKFNALFVNTFIENLPLDINLESKFVLYVNKDAYKFFDWIKLNDNFNPI